MIYVTSDWHGIALEKIKRLLEKANFTESDELYVLGDVIDRGDFGVELLKWIMPQSNVHLILGNHESMMLECDFLFDDISDEAMNALNPIKTRYLERWRRNGADTTIEALKCERQPSVDRIVEYLKAAPLYAELSAGGRSYRLVHGGLGDYFPERPLERYTPHDLVWTRPEWDTEYSKDFVTVVGHTPTIVYGTMFRNRIIKHETWWDIDTGAACGYYPMLLCLDNEAEFYLSDEDFM